MKTTTILMMILLSATMISCKHANKYNDKLSYPYSKEETEQFLDEITKNATAYIGDITEIERQPTDELYIITRKSLSDKELEEYNQNSGTIYNTNDDIEDFTKNTIKDYSLVNERGEKLHVLDDGRTAYLQEYGLWVYDNVLCQNLGINITLDKKYEKLNGYITIEFIMPGTIFGKIKREVKIPVNITIHDEV